MAIPLFNAKKKHPGVFNFTFSVFNSKKQTNRGVQLHVFCLRFVSGHFEEKAKRTFLRHEGGCALA